MQNRQSRKNIFICGEKGTSQESSLVTQKIKNLSAMRETRVPSLGGEDPLEIWQPTPAFLPGESHGQKSLEGYSSWGPKESDTTEWLTLSLSNKQENRTIG